MQLSDPFQGVIYPVLHRTLRIKIWALQTNCEMQSKKCESKNLLRSGAIDASQQLARITIASTISRSRKLVLPQRSPAPVLNSHRRDLRFFIFIIIFFYRTTRLTVDSVQCVGNNFFKILRHTADNAQFPDLSAHSETGRSTWWGCVFTYT